ncbi:MAG: YIP1 family protein [Deltaproteobacteria bacterium]|nr:YIP1 family protein [Deltaproteobacteria bacterium]
MDIVLTCPYCNLSKKVPEDKIPSGARRAVCPRCRQEFEFSHNGKTEDSLSELTGIYYEQEGSGQKTGDDLPEENPPWEKRAEIGLWKGISGTIKAVLFSPEQLFRKIKYRGGMKEPLAYAILMGSIGFMLSFFWQFLIASGGFVPVIGSYLSQFAMGVIILGFMIIIPVFVVIGIFINSGLWHILLLIVRGANNGFEATFRVVAYSQSTHIFAVIPFIGSLIGSIWRTIVQIIGLREIHNTSYLRVIIAFLIPVAFIVFSVIAVIMAVILYLR